MINDDINNGINDDNDVNDDTDDNNLHPGQLVISPRIALPNTNTTDNNINKNNVLFIFAYSINQATKQSSNQSTNQSIKQSINSSLLFIIQLVYVQ